VFRLVFNVAFPGRISSKSNFWSNFTHSFPISDLRIDPYSIGAMLLNWGSSVRFQYSDIHNHQTLYISCETACEIDEIEPFRLKVVNPVFKLIIFVKSFDVEFSPLIRNRPVIIQVIIIIRCFGNLYFDIIPWNLSAFSSRFESTCRKAVIPSSSFISILISSQNGNSVSNWLTGKCQN
jgi:hypothetical protein